MDLAKDEQPVEAMTLRTITACLATAALLVACAAPVPRVHGQWSPGLEPGAVFRDCPDCPEMVVIPAGRLVMGSPGDEAGRYRQEGPQRDVTIAQAFALGRTEVTRTQWERFVADSGYRTPPGCHVWNGERTAPDAKASWRDPGFAQDGRHPAVCISWNDARDYVAWLSRRTGKTYRLPSEEEWEYAARAGSAQSRHWGDSPAGACEFANVSDITGAKANPAWIAHPCDDGHVFTAPAGSLRANRFGLYDTAGNVWEWTSGCWTEQLGGVPSHCFQRVLRGGSWMSLPAFARSATRHRLDIDMRFSEIGFRVLRQP